MPNSEMLTAPTEGSIFAETAEDAIRAVHAVYDQQTGFLRDQFETFIQDPSFSRRVRACYPFVRITVDRFQTTPDSILSYGFVDSPGVYEATVTRPTLFDNYLRDQFEQLFGNHKVPLEIGVSDLPIPVHFAFPEGLHVEGRLDADRMRTMRDHFDLPDLAVMDDSIVNGTFTPAADAPTPLALFTAPRADYSLYRLSHYTKTDCHHFQNYVIFTNYQMYIDDFCKFAEEIVSDPESPYTAFVEPGNHVTHKNGSTEGTRVERLPQMPAYHLVRPGHCGITMVNIGVGPSNAKTITDHVAVLRPHAWLMLGHCAGLRNTQKLGDYVLAHGYVREDHVLDADLPTWVPVPPLAEVQRALEDAVAEITGLSGLELKSVMRTGTVATIDNRNWELRDVQEPIQRFSQSRAIALDMESATIASNGFRFRVPYGTLLCISDKPMHGEIKLPGMADAFYQTQVRQHLKIGLLALEKLSTLPLGQLHSRKLRSFNEAAFL